MIIGTSNAGAKIVNNVIHDNANNNSGDVGVSINSESATVSGNVLTNVNLGLNMSAGSGLVTGNTVYGNPQGMFISGNASPGVTVSNNIVVGNTYVGIYALSNVVVAGNTVYGQVTSEGIRLYGAMAHDNVVFDNLYGINDYAGSSTIQNNRVYHNSSVGIITNYGGTYTGNIVYGNGVGIQGYSVATIRNNLVYSNTSFGVNLSGGGGGFSTATRSTSRPATPCISAATSATSRAGITSSSRWPATQKAWRRTAKRDSQAITTISSFRDRRRFSTGAGNCSRRGLLSITNSVWSRTGKRPIPNS